MSGYGDIKTKNFLNVIKWLASNKGVEIKKGGRHNIKASCIHTGESYPLPTSHRIINKYVLNGFVSWLVKNGICTKEEFDERLK